MTDTIQDSPECDSPPPAPKQVMPLSSMGPCIIGAFAIVAAVFLVPWPAVGQALAAVAGTVAGWVGVALSTPLVAGKAGAAVALATLVGVMCVFEKARRRNQPVPHENVLGGFGMVAVAWLFLMFVSALYHDLKSGLSADAVLQLFEEPAAPGMALVHRMSPGEAAALTGLDPLSTRDMAKIRSSLAAAQATGLPDRQWRDWAFAASELSDPQDHHHAWSPGMCQRLEKAYLASPLDIQQRYRLTIEGQVVKPGATAGAACNRFQASSVNVRLAWVKQ